MCVLTGAVTSPGSLPITGHLSHALIPVWSLVIFMHHYCCILHNFFESLFCVFFVCIFAAIYCVMLFFNYKNKTKTKQSQLLKTIKDDVYVLTFKHIIVFLQSALKDFKKYVILT